MGKPWAITLGELMEKTMEEEVAQDMRRSKEPIASVWSPSITEKERAERQEQIEEGILPF